jgi:hypothetical protein
LGQLIALWALPGEVMKLIILCQEKREMMTPRNHKNRTAIVEDNEKQ